MERVFATSKTFGVLTPAATMKRFIVEEDVSLPFGRSHAFAFWQMLPRSGWRQPSAERSQISEGMLTPASTLRFFALDTVQPDQA